MADQQFDILIKFGLSKEKATEAVAEIKKLETATAKSNQTARAGAADLSKTTAELGNNVAATSKKVGELNLKQGEWMKLTTLLPPGIRQIGQALRFAFSSPMVATAAALLVTVRAFVALFHEAKQRLDELKLGDLNREVGAIAGAAGTAAAKWEEWRKAIQDTGTAADDTVAKLRAQLEAAGEVTDAEMNLARAKVEADSSLSPEQKKQRLGEIDEQQAQFRTNRARQLRAAEIAAAETKLAEARAADENAFGQRVGLARASSSAAGALTDNQQTIANLDEELARLDEKAKTGSLTPTEFTMRQTLFAQREELRARQPGLQSAASAAASSLSAFDQRASQNRASIPRLESQLGNLRSADALATATETTVGGLNARARRIVDPAALVGNAAAGADAIRGGGSASADQAAAIAKLTELLGLQRMSHQAILQMFSRMNDGEKEFQNSLRTVRNQQ